MTSLVFQSALEAQAAGRWSEALAGYEQAFQAAAREGDAELTADVLRRIGMLHAERGELELASDLLEASLAVAQANRLQDRVAFALIGKASVEQRSGRLDEADALYGRGGAIAESLGEERVVAMVAQNLGTIANVRGDLEAALHQYRSAHRRYERLGDDLACAGALCNMGMAHVDLGQWGAAASCLDQAFVLADRQQEISVVGNVEINRAELFLRSGQFALARESCDRAYEIFGRLQSESGLAEACKLYGILFRETGKAVLADAHLASATEAARRCQDRLLEAESLSEWALVHLAEGRNRQALQCLNGAHHIFSALHASRDLLDLDRRLDGLENTYLQVVRAWGESIESKDRYTAGHCERVANYACLLAEAVGITGRELTWMRMGGYLHDVGKIAVPLEVLNKPGKLTPEEFRLIQSHTTEGDAIVAELNFPWDIRPLVRSHHERWDGTGYPDGLAGEQIPLHARILCVADVYDALTSTRSYRPALSRDEALRIMEGDSGRLFDPELFALFRGLISAETPAPDLRFPAFGAGVAAA